VGHGGCLIFFLDLKLEQFLTIIKEAWDKLKDTGKGGWGKLKDRWDKRRLEKKRLKKGKKLDKHDKNYKLVGLRITEGEEIEGLDIVLHGEKGYNL